MEASLPVIFYEDRLPEPVCVLPAKPSLAAIQAFERELLKMPQVDIPVTHHFASGLYAREIFIPKGTTLTGKKHLTGHFNFLMKGQIKVVTEDGVLVLTAPAIIPSAPGIKRAGVTLEDTVWVTVHATNETDLVALEKEIIEPEIPALTVTDDGKEQLCHGSQLP